MRITRRSLFLGVGAGAVGVLLASCTPEPEPTKEPVVTPSPDPTSSVPAPTVSVRSAWATDDFALGATSFVPVAVQASARQTLANPIDGRLFIAGEATDMDNPGTMRGAISAGRNAANEILRAANDGERIAIVGAGLAGATATAQIMAAGFEVTVFEARDRTGGRVHSVVSDDWPMPAQLGGWLLGANDEDLKATISDLDVLSADLTTGLWQSPEAEVEPPSPQPVQAAVDGAQAQPADATIIQALTTAGVNVDDPAIMALLTYFSATSGVDADAASAWYPPALPDEALSAPLGDLSPLIDTLIEGARVTLSSPVSGVAADETGVSLRLGTGESLTFDRVVLTVPLGVLQQNGIMFDPPLPLAHRGAIQALSVGHIETVWLQFDEPFWQTDAAIWHLVDGDAAVRTWLNLEPATGQNVLVGIVGGTAAAEFAALSDGDALTAAVRSLEVFAEPAAS